MRAKHGWTSYDSADAGGRYREWYTDDDNGSGYGEDSMTQRWYGANPPTEPPDPNGWQPLRAEDGPDRTDPGYWRDNY